MNIITLNPSQRRTLGRDGSIAFPRSLGDYPPGLGLSLLRHAPWTTHPGHVRSRVPIPQPVLLANGSQSGSSWESLWQGRDGEAGTAVLLENWEEGPPLGGLASRSAGELQAATALPPSSSARGAAALLASVCVLWSREGGGNPSPTSLRAQK